MPTQELGCQSQAGLRGSGWDSVFPNPLEGGAHGQLGVHLVVVREYHLRLVLVLPLCPPPRQLARLGPTQQMPVWTQRWRRPWSLRV